MEAEPKGWLTFPDALSEWEKNNRMETHLTMRPYVYSCRCPGQAGHQCAWFVGVLICVRPDDKLHLIGYVYLLAENYLIST